MKDFKRAWIHHRNRLARGQTEISLFYGVFQMTLIFWLFLRDVTTFSRLWLFLFLPLCFLGVTGLMYLIGWFMDTRGLIDELQQWDRERDPMVREILKGVRQNASSSR